MEADKIFTLKIPGRIENLSRILDFAAEAMEFFGMDEDGAFDVNVAMDEACTNVINYSDVIDFSGVIDSFGVIDSSGVIDSFGGKNDIPDIEVTATRRDGMFFVTVTSRGGYFDPTIPAAPDTSSDIDERKVGGLGVYFMQQLMDKLQYGYNDGAGTLTMGKRLPNAADCGTHKRSDE
jgi:anti-sigma regulatory factor (Ser/Thr protein kinase)